MKKIIIVLGILLVLAGIGYAFEGQEIFDNLTVNGMLNVTGGIYTPIATADNLTGNLTWTDLYDYPVACPAGTSITQLGDSVVCTAFAQEDTNVTFKNITADYINEVDFTNITVIGNNIIWEIVF